MRQEQPRSRSLAILKVGVFREFTAEEFEAGALHTWAKKRFIESYLAWAELEQDQFLLRDGELKQFLAGVAEQRELPATDPSDEELRRRGILYCAKVKTWSQEIVKLHADAQKKADQQAHARSVAGLQESLSKLGERETNPDLLAKVERQKAELIAKGYSL